MRRRTFLATIAAAGTVGVAGCLGGEVVLEVQESVRIQAHGGWAQEIDGVGGSGSISYTVRSDDERFQVLYFTEDINYEKYQARTAGTTPNANGTAGSDPANVEVPLGHDDLSRIAIQNEDRGVYEAVVPRDGGRYSIDVKGTHYFVVDYSNYGIGMQVPDTAEPIQATVGLEVVEDRL
jgi:hypothetical protein